MGSPLGCLFANMYMCSVENSVLENADLKPSMYCRYVDDIFVDVHDEQHLQQLRRAMEDTSVLKYTTKTSVNNRIPFLDISIEVKNGEFSTTVYRKPTDVGRCMNGSSECPERYKTAVIRSFIRRAFSHCSDWTSLHQELERSKQVLINNGYSNSAIDREINSFMERQKTPSQDNTTIQLYYRNQMSPAYKVDQRVLKSIIRTNVAPTDDDTKVVLTIYYKSPHISNFLITNNTATKTKLKQTNVIYEFHCPYGDCLLCDNSSYIGMTTTSLSRRLTMHLRDGAINDHITTKHGRSLTRQDLDNNTTIIKTCNTRRRLQIIEALTIRERNPELNKQLKSCITLDLFAHSVAR